MSQSCIPVVLCGGSGTRLWPLSRKHRPKQLQHFTHTDSLLQQAIQRIQSITMPLTQPIVVCNEMYRFDIAAQLQAKHIEALAILLEPEGHNTAPALTLAALHALAVEKDPILWVMPADHYMQDGEALQKAVNEAITLAAHDHVVLFGVTPKTPHTGYGYIQAERASNRTYPVKRFVEKPDAAAAKVMLADGHYYWNSGMFVLKARIWLELLAQHAPAMHEACLQAYQKQTRDGLFVRIDAEAWQRCSKDSIDYAVIEKLSATSEKSKLTMVPLTMAWSDLGDWPALQQILPHDAQQNATRGDVQLHSSQHSLVVSEDRLIVGIGLQDMIVVDSKDALLIMSASHATELKSVVAELEQQGRLEVIAHRRIYRPWGYYEHLDQGERFQVKHLMIHPGASLSLQIHHHRAEHWVVVRGTAQVTRGDENFLLSENQSTYIPLGVQHRLHNPGHIPLEIIEVQSGSYLGEDDIIRLQDNYGRN